VAVLEQVIVDAEAALKAQTQPASAQDLARA
jgi:hypothetical protein